MSCLAAIEAAQARHAQAVELLKWHDDLTKVVVFPRETISSIVKLIQRCRDGSAPNSWAEIAGDNAIEMLKPYLTTTL